MGTIIIQNFKTPYGELILGSLNDQLCMADWLYRKMRPEIDKRMQTLLNATYAQGESAVIEKTKQELNEYFRGERKVFDIPLLLAGTEFQKRVWEELQKIAYGRITTYLELSRSIGNEKSIRAVAGANGANAISIIVPCHRVIGSDGSLTGYAGGTRVKEKLLALENATRFPKQMNLFE